MAEAVAAWRDAGVDHLILAPATTDMAQLTVDGTHCTRPLAAFSLKFECDVDGLASEPSCRIGSRETGTMIALLGGTGNLGYGLARRWVLAGQAVAIGSRTKVKALSAARSLRELAAGKPRALFAAWADSPFPDVYRDAVGFAQFRNNWRDDRGLGQASNLLLPIVSVASQGNKDFYSPPALPTGSGRSQACTSH